MSATQPIAPAFQVPIEDPDLRRMREVARSLAVIICPVCVGEGEIRSNPGWPDPQAETFERCRDCGGTGRAAN